MIYLGVVELGLAYVQLARGFREVPAFEGSLLILLEPALSPIWAFLFHGEVVGALARAGGALILAATTLKTWLDARDADDATEGEIAAGGAVASGNARSFQGTVNGRVRVRRRAHEGRAAVAGNYGRAAADVSAPIETTVLNVQGMARYDYFFAPRWSAFLMATARHDRFQGLDLRLNIDPGVAFYALQKPNHRLWFEAGYDFQLDVRRDEAIFVREENDADGDGTVSAGDALLRRSAAGASDTPRSRPAQRLM